ELVEVARADLALVPGRRVAASFGAELRFLQFHVGRHLPFAVARGQVEHGIVERMESGQGDELEAVAHRTELALEVRYGPVIEIPAPVEGRRAVVREQLVRVARMDCLRE